MYVIKRLLGVFCSDETPKMSHSFRQMDSMPFTPYGWIHIGSGVVAKMQVFLLILMRVAHFEECGGACHRWAPRKYPACYDRKVEAKT